MDKENKILELQSMLRRDRDHIYHGCMQCLIHGEEITSRSIAKYSHNSKFYVESVEEKWRPYV